MKKKIIAYFTIAITLSLISFVLNAQNADDWMQKQLREQRFITNSYRSGFLNKWDYNHWKKLSLHLNRRIHIDTNLSYCITKYQNGPLSSSKYISQWLKQNEMSSKFESTLLKQSHSEIIHQYSQSVTDLRSVWTYNKMRSDMYRAMSIHLSLASVTGLVSASSFMINFAIESSPQPLPHNLRKTQDIFSKVNLFTNLLRARIAACVANTGIWLCSKIFSDKGQRIMDNFPASSSFDLEVNKSGVSPFTGKWTDTVGTISITQAYSYKKMLPGWGAPDFYSEGNYSRTITSHIRTREIISPLNDHLTIDPHSVFIKEYSKYFPNQSLKVPLEFINEILPRSGFGDTALKSSSYNQYWVPTTYSNNYLSGAVSRRDYISRSLDLFEKGYRPTNPSWTSWRYWGPTYHFHDPYRKWR
jgi:hypothetical protein